MVKLKKLFSPGKPIPLLILLLGLLIVVDGFYTAVYYRPQVTNFVPTMTADPYIYQGMLKAVIGAAITVLGYLLYHGKIRYFNNT